MKKLILLAVILFIPSVSSGAFDTNLSYGSSGPKVLELQEFLTAQGVYSGPITGNFYSLTLAGVKSLQIKLGVSPTSGFFGPLTRTSANAILTATLAPAVGAAIDETGNDVLPVEEDKTEELVREIKKLNETVKTQQSQLEAIKENTKPKIVVPQAVKVSPTSAILADIRVVDAEGLITIEADAVPTAFPLTIRVYPIVIADGKISNRGADLANQRKETNCNLKYSDGIERCHYTFTYNDIDPLVTYYGTATFNGRIEDFNISTKAGGSATFDYRDVKFEVK